MPSRLRTLASHSAAYGLGSVAAKLVAIFLLPVYTTYLDPSDYGRAELVLVLDLFFVAFIRLGLQNSMMRFWHKHADDGLQDHVIRVNVTTTFLGSLVGVAILGALAVPLSRFFFGTGDEWDLILIGAFGIFGSTIYGTLTSILRLQQRPRAFVIGSLATIACIVGCTVLFVVVLGMQAEGMLLGTFVGRFLVVPPLAFMMRQYLAPSLKRSVLGPMLRFGLPTLPLAIATQARPLVDRSALVKYAGSADVGLFALGMRMATVVQLAVTALQLSWQPFAYSIKDDEEARDTYAQVMSWYLAIAGWLVVTTAVLADPMVRLLTTPAFYDAIELVPILAAAAGIYGISFIGGIPAGRVDHSKHFLYAAAAAVIVTVAGNLTLVPEYGTWGAAWSLIGANTVLAGFMVVGSQRHFHVPYQWLRMLSPAALVAIACIATPLLPPTTSPLDVVTRCVLALAYVPILGLTGFASRSDWRAVRHRVRRS